MPYVPSAFASITYVEFSPNAIYSIVDLPEKTPLLNVAVTFDAVASTEVIEVLPNG